MDSRFIHALTGLALLSGLPSQAQLLAPAHDQQWWLGSKLVTAPAAYPPKVVIEDIPTRQKREVEYPKGTRNVWFADHAIWSYRVTRDEQGTRGHLGMQPWGSEWRKMSVLERDEPQLPDRVYPLSDQWFLGNRELGFVHDKKAGHFALFRLNSKERLELQEVLDLRVNDIPYALLDKKGSVPNPVLGTPGSNFITDYRVLPWEGGLVLAHYWTGCLWVLDSRGRIRHALNPMELKRVHFKRGIEVAVKTIQPTRDGRLLIAMRNEQAVKTIPFLFDTEITLDHMKDPKRMRRSEEALVESIEKFPDLEWYECEPASGNFRRIPTPHGGADKLSKPKDAMFYTFTFRPDGSIESTVKPR